MSALANHNNQAQQVWVEVCSESDLVIDSGVCALVEGQSVAIFAIKQKGQVNVYAVQCYDPFGKANVLSRGLIGSKGDQLFVASPLYKQRFDLVSGECLDDDSVQIQAFQTKVEDGLVYIQTV